MVVDDSLRVREYKGHRRHAAADIWPISGLYMWRPHATGCELPKDDQKPGGTDVHAEALVARIKLETVPAAHGCGMDEPNTQKLPAGHMRHTVAPL